jgi:rubrerythrin
MSPAATLDFPTLSLQDALDLAILIEEEAQERYLEFVDQMEQHHAPEAARFFASMSENEKKHGDELRARRRALFGNAPSRVTRSQLWDVEAPGYDQPRALMTARQAMQVALAAENKAHEFFVAALPHVHDLSVKELFTELRDEELLHQSLVQDAMRNLPDAEEPDASAYEDEPVAH